MKFSFTTFFALSILATPAFCKSTTFQNCGLCGTLECLNDHYHQDDGQAWCQARGDSAEWRKGANFLVNTHGDACRLYVDANWNDVGVGAGIGHMDCLVEGKNIRCNKVTNTASQAWCGKHFYCENQVTCEW